MIISSIIIDNIKGISHYELKQAIQPNRPNILVAPNGFGKSSFAAAFNSLQPTKLVLKPEDFHTAGVPGRLALSLTTMPDLLVADTDHNDITSHFSVFVVNSPLLPTAKAQRFGKIVTAKASMDIAVTTLIKNIPNNIQFAYKFTIVKRAFGSSYKVLSDISLLFTDLAFIKKIDKRINFHVFELAPYKRTISSILSSINQIHNLRAVDIKRKINEEHWFETIHQEYKDIATLIKARLGYTDDADAYLAAWQYIYVKLNMKGDFKKAIEYLSFCEKRKRLDKTLNDVNPVRDRFVIASKVSGRSLIVEWPKAHLISSGQRDIMVFIARLMECEYQSTGNCILVIDEFFDYLDDANVVAFQYYISTLIDTFKHEKRIIFPIILTHLDPNYLKHFCFNDCKMNICYLKNVRGQISQFMRKFVAKRENHTIKDIVDQYYFHYQPLSDGINICKELEKLSLNKDWGTPQAFHKKVFRECRSYLLEPDKKYDPLAVCFAVRLKIEELVYSQIPTEHDKEEFLRTHGTTEKLSFAQRIGVSFSETYYLLGIIYNHPLHSTEDDDFSKPLSMKLENVAIHTMIINLWH